MIKENIYAVIQISMFSHISTGIQCEGIHQEHFFIF